MSESPVIRTARQIKKQLKLLLHAGTKYECPLCGYRSRDLAPIGHDYEVLRRYKVVGAARRRGGCYRCGAYDRDKLVYLYLRDGLQIFSPEKKNYRILHIAPSHAIASRLHAHGFAGYVAGDLFTKGYHYPDYVREMNVLRLPFEDETFDLVLCNHVLEHIEDDRRAMREIYRVMKCGAEAILQVPLSGILEKSLEDPALKSEEERARAFGQRDHVRIYGRDYFERLGEVGFRVEEKDLSAAYPRCGLNPGERLTIALKTP